MQSFSGGGTPFVTETFGGAPPPIISGGVGTLVSDLGSQRNNITFVDTGLKSEGGIGVITISFDYFMPDETGHTGCCGERADGFGFGLLATATYGTFGPMVGGWGAVEQDALGSALTVGFDIFTGAGSDGAVDDNNVRLGWNGTTIANNAFGPAFKLNNGLTNRVQMTIVTNGTDMIIDMSIITGAGVTQSVFSAVTVPGASVPNSRVVFAGRTGGAWTKVDLDNISILSSFTPGPVSVTGGPDNQTVTESQTATFTIGVDGTPPYTVQWFSNNVAISGASDLSYTTPATTTNMSGTLYRADVTNSLGNASSTNATLTVNAGLLVQTVSTGGKTNEVRIKFNKPAALVGTYTINNGVTVNSASYGTSQSEVVLNTTMLTADTLYTLTVLGETGQDASALVPNPTVRNFFQGFGTFTCTDFGTLPAGTALFSNATLAAYLGSDGTANNVLHLVDDAITGSYGNFYISNRTGGATIDTLRARWKQRIGGPLFAHADGYSFNWAQNVPADGVYRATEEGEGTGVSFTVDSWDNGAGPDTGIEIKWQGTRIAFQHIDREGIGNIITKDVLVNVEASVDIYGRATFTYDGNTISAVIPGWTGIANGAMNMSARTGGEADNYWIDDLCINNFTLGPIFFAQQPVETTVLEFLPATFTAVVDGTPPYFYQWFTNGVPVPGANGATYTIASATVAHEGLQVSVNSSNLFSSVTSSNAVLHVDTSPRVLAVRSVGENTVHVLWHRPVDLNSGFYNFDNGIFENLRDYGSNHNEIVILTDPLVPATTYTITIDSVTEEGNPANDQFPNPAIVSFRHGYGIFCADFESGLPVGTTVTGSATVSGGVLHVTDAINSQAGSYFVPDSNAGFPVDRLLIKFRTLIGTPAAFTRIADGFSINFGADISSAVNGEEGQGGSQGLVVSFDSWDNAAADTAPAIEVKYKNIVVATQSMAGIRDLYRPANGPLLADANGNFLSMDTSNAFVNFMLVVGPDGKLSLYFKDYTIFHNLQLPSYTPFVGAKLNISGRTGGANENAWFDDMCINNFSLGGVSITQNPANTTIDETKRALFTVGVNGLPSYTAQWYSNGVPIPGATALSYLTPPLNRLAHGAAYTVAVSNSLGGAVSSAGIVSITQDTIAPTGAAFVGCLAGFTNIVLQFNEPVNPATANNPLFYTVSGGLVVLSASLQPDGRTVVLTVSGTLSAPNCYKVTVAGVQDASGFNVASFSTIVPVKEVVQAAAGGTLLVVEAEDADAVPNVLLNGIFTTWRFNTSPNGIANFPAAAGTFSGTGDMEAVPNANFSVADNVLNVPRLDYCVNFPSSGTWYVWIRYVGATGSDNSFFVGIDGAESPTGLRIGNNVNANRYEWNNFNQAGGAARITVPTPGVHTFSIWMREDAVRIDKILLTSDAGFTFSDIAVSGPESTRPSPNPRLRAVKNPDNSATISWPGAGWVLQGTTNFPAPPTAPIWQNLPFTSPLVIPPGLVNSNVFFRLICP